MLKSAGFGKQFKEAGKSGARYAIIVGEEEAKEDLVKVKDLRSGKEIPVGIKNLTQKLEELDAEGGISRIIMNSDIPDFHKEMERDKHRM